MKARNYTLYTHYPDSTEEVNTLRGLLGMEYLKLIKSFLKNLDISSSQKKEIAILIYARIKSK
ncbi:hypothetical protein CLHUN_00160 [Ruminiclostridium hungatei]|uniref:Uncharacterized protein n=1 Tax=Ruminiclostridium hungatei TaxID=48256 RepID=A0A1V4SQR9_RUMHU|nr:hypothetical protein [Ruminiclostridium hungatei]OPX46200.1 hypothetical protein CLHUN_00160 [Ruminiclostridium hungatei]